MNISRIIKKVLLEDDENKTMSRGLDPKTQDTYLRGVIQNCPKIGNGAFVGRNIKTLGKDKLDQFPELKATGVDSAAYVTGQVGNNFYMAFGVNDVEAKTPALLAYRLQPKGQPEKVKNGLGGDINCEQLTKVQDLGQIPLSPQNKTQFDNFISTEGAGYATLTEPMAKDISLYEKVPYSELTYRDGRPVFDPIPREPGYAWVQKGMRYSTQNKNKQIEIILGDQSFTLDEPEDITSDSSKYAFYLKDILNDWPALNSQKNAVRPNQIIYPLDDILYPDRQTCKTAIKKLDYCITSPVGKDCGKDLFKNKFIALRCGDLKMVGGVLGMKDEFQNIMQRGKPYGLSDLKRVVGKAQYGDVQKESLESKINFILNEQRKKLRF